MPDERNVAHDKKVQQDKEDRGEEIAPGAAETPQPGRKPRMEGHEGDGRPRSRRRRLNPRSSAAIGRSSP